MESILKQMDNLVATTRGSDEIEEMWACSAGSGVHGHYPLIFPGEGQSRSRRAKTRAVGPLLSNQASPG